MSMSQGSQGSEGSEGSQGSASSVEEPVAQLAKIFKATVPRDTGGTTLFSRYDFINFRPWDGKQPGPNDVVFILVK